MKVSAVLIATVLLFCLVACGSGGRDKASSTGQPVASDASSRVSPVSSQYFIDDDGIAHNLDDIDFAEPAYTVDWYTIQNLPDGFPKLSEYVTFAKSSGTVIDISWNILSNKKHLEFIEKLEEYAGKAFESANESYPIYNCEIEDQNNKYKLTFIYQPYEDGQYHEEVQNWASQAKLYIYIETKN